MENEPRQEELKALHEAVAGSLAGEALFFAYINALAEMTEAGHDRIPLKPYVKAVQSTEREMRMYLDTMSSEIVVKIPHSTAS